MSDTREESWKELEASDWRKSETGSGHSQRFEFLLEKGIWSDVTFHVGKDKEVFEAHKLVLRTGSKVFSDLLNEDKNKSQFDIPDLGPQEFGHLLKFLYTGETTKNVEDALPLLKAACKYEVPNLIRICGELLGETLTAVNALTIYQQAIMYGEKELEERAMKCICSCGYEIMKSAEFLDISVKELASILSRDDLQIPNEAKLFDAVMNWARAECKRQGTLETHKYLRSILEEVIPFIRFPLMDPSDFGLNVVSTNILLTEEVMSVLVYFNVRLDDRSSVSTGVFNSKPRVTYVPRGQNYVLHRLNKSEDFVRNLSTKNCTGYKYIEACNLEQSIRLRSSIPIWLKSVGMNSTGVIIDDYDCHYYSDDSVSVKIQLKDDEKNILASKTETVSGVRARASDVYHIQFSDPVYLHRDEWYLVSFTVLEGRFYGNNYTAVDGVGTSLDFKLTDGSEKVIKFGFRNDESPTYTGVTQGFIPEIGFMVD